MFVGEDASVRQGPTLRRMLTVVGVYCSVGIQRVSALQAPVAGSLFLVVLLRPNIVMVYVHTPFVTAKVHDRVRIGACVSFLLLAKLEALNRETRRVFRCVGLVGSEYMVQKDFLVFDERSGFGWILGKPAAFV